MKKKIVFLGSLCLIVALGLVISGCPNEVQKIEYKSVGAPKNVTAVYVPEVTTGTNPKGAHVKITWDVNPDASGYNIVFQQPGKKLYITTEEWVGTYERTSTGSIVDHDKYVYELPRGGIPTGELKFGVVSRPRTGWTNNSKPEWAPTTVTMPAYQ